MQLLKFAYITIFNIYQEFHCNLTKSVYHYYIVYVGTQQGNEHDIEGQMQEQYKIFVYPKNP